MNGGKTWLALATGIFLFAATVSGVDLRAPGSGPFKVMVAPAVTKVTAQKTFTLYLRVQNISKTRQEFETLACSWYVNWTMDSHYLQFPTWDCEIHPSYKVSLAPGASWTNHIEMTIGKSIPTNRVTLRVGFSPEIVYPNRDKKQPSPTYYWSRPVTLEVAK